MEILIRQKTGTRTPDRSQRAASFGNLKKVQLSMDHWEINENGYWFDCITENIKFDNMQECMDYIMKYEGHIRNLHIYAL